LEKNTLLGQSKLELIIFSANEKEGREGIILYIIISFIIFGSDDQRIGCKPCERRVHNMHIMSIGGK
jgi:hypothetical protein